MTPLQSLLAHYRATSQTEREKGTYFEVGSKLQVEFPS